MGNDFHPAIITKCDKKFEKFIRNAIEQFFAELDLYTSHNRDSVLLWYANERTLASLFVNGLIRNDGKKHLITSVQEYGTFFEKGSRYGRPDIFIRYDDIGIWIESKYERNIKMRDNHWDVIAWLEWDMKEILSQVERYYIGEFESVNDTYKEHYIMTLAFKLLEINSEEFYRIINEKLVPLHEKEFDRPWYYSAGFINRQSKSLGVEVFGTFKKMR